MPEYRVLCNVCPRRPTAGPPKQIGLRRTAAGAATLRKRHLSSEAHKSAAEEFVLEAVRILPPVG